MYRHLYIYFSLLFVIASCGGGGGGSTPEPPVPGASITLSISDDQIYLGNTVTLTWSTSMHLLVQLQDLGLAQKHYPVLKLLRQIQKVKKAIL